MTLYRKVVKWCLFNDFHPILLFYFYIDKKIKEPKNIEFTYEQLNKYIHILILI